MLSYQLNGGRFIQSLLYNLFISHSWTYSDQYNRLCHLLDHRPWFYWRDYSVPKDDPIHNAITDVALAKAIEEKMKHASVVLILAGIYSTYSEWIKIEIAIANKLGKPIIAIKPWGNEKISQVVRDHADTIVGWNKESVVDAIRKLSQ